MKYARMYDIVQAGLVLVFNEIWFDVRDWPNYFYFSKETNPLIVTSGLIVRKR